MASPSTPHEPDAAPGPSLDTKELASAHSVARDRTLIASMPARRSDQDQGRAVARIDHGILAAFAADRLRGPAVRRAHQEMSRRVDRRFHGRAHRRAARHESQSDYWRHDPAALE